MPSSPQPSASGLAPPASSPLLAESALQELIELKKALIEAEQMETELDDIEAGLEDMHACILKAHASRKQTEETLYDLETKLEQLPLSDKLTLSLHGPNLSVKLEVAKDDLRLFTEKINYFTAKEQADRLRLAKFRERGQRLKALILDKLQKQQNPDA